MSDAAEGYRCYWRRMALHLGLSDVAKALGGGIRASQLSAFERGQEHGLTEEQIRAYADYLFSQPVEIPEVDEFDGDEEE
jgi:hypothetical protein